MHLEADLHDVVAWANAAGRRWAFSLSNASASYVQFCASLADLEQINWEAVAARDWRAAEIKEGKQAEFLVHEWFPWDLVSRIGVRSLRASRQVQEALQAANHHPKIEIRHEWYY